MRLRRGIDLTASIPPVRHHEYEASTGVYGTVQGLREWEVLGAKCARCGHIGWLDTAKVMRQYGNQYLHSIGGKLLCRCGNKTGNKVLVGVLGRN